MMKAGTETGSLMNHLMSKGAGAVDKEWIGDGATILKWTDRTACTVVEVSKSGKTIVVQEDTVVRTDSNGMSDSQSYDYHANPNGAKHTFKLCKGGWREAGTGGKGNGLLLGARRHYHDFSF